MVKQNMNPAINIQIKRFSTSCSLNSAIRSTQQTGGHQVTNKKETVNHYEDNAASLNGFLQVPTMAAFGHVIQHVF
jgi:hypothetical protein